MEHNPESTARDLYEDADFEEQWQSEDWQDDFEDEEEAFESFPPELLARSMSDALERLKNFDPFAI